MALIQLPSFVATLRQAVGVAIALLLAIVCVAQTPTAPPTDARGVIRLRVRVRVGASTKGLSRKRFFLTRGSLEQNKTLVQAIHQRPVISRDCYYRGIGASAGLMKWLKESDCESVYCREIESQDIEGAEAVPEFQKAVATGEQEFKSRKIARKWLPVNLPANIRAGFYKRSQEHLRELIKQAEMISGAKVLSVMTDRNGTAYFTDLEPGTYVISNLVPTDVGNTSLTWNCEIRVKPGDLATEKPFQISNPANKDKNVKCVGMEKPLPACETTQHGERVNLAPE